MQIFKIKDMVKGWFVGNFNPTAYKTSQSEVAYKSYKSGYIEKKHYHLHADEVTLLISGSAKFNEILVKKGDIVIVSKGECIEFYAIEDCETVVFKSCSLPNDKFEM